MHNGAHLIVREIDLPAALIAADFISKTLCKARMDELIDECMPTGYKVSPILPRGFS